MPAKLRLRAWSFQTCADPKYIYRSHVGDVILARLSFTSPGSPGAGVGAFYLHPMVIWRCSLSKIGMDYSESALLEEGGRERLCQCLGMTSAKVGSMKNAAETVKRLKEAGVDVVW